MTDLIDCGVAAATKFSEHLERTEHVGVAGRVFSMTDHLDRGTTEAVAYSSRDTGRA